MMSRRAPSDAGSVTKNNRPRNDDDPRPERDTEKLATDQDCT